jgi:GrpB-like predicted nucleotidyltransferase (UPF0157 family)
LAKEQAAVGRLIAGAAGYLVMTTGPADAKLAGMTGVDPAEMPAWAVEQVRVLDYDPKWPEHAEVFAGELRRLLADWLTGPVVHVGSTAIPRLRAKPIIDLQATAQDPAAAISSTRDALAAASWFFVPRELDQRPWRWFVVRADSAGRHRLAHLHLMRPDEPRWRQQIAFRDRLRVDPALRDEYADLKAAAAQTFAQDREAYTAAKSAFVQRVDGGALPPEPGSVRREPGSSSNSI